MTNIQEVINAWKSYLSSIDNWEALIEGVESKPTGCGPVYELPSPFTNRPNEDLAIADMRNMGVAEPHYHPTGVTEIYFALQGGGLVVVGGKEEKVEPGSVIIMPENTAHFTIPESNLVFAVGKYSAFCS